MPRPFGKDRVEERMDGTVRLSSPKPKGWCPRRPAGPGVVLHPGTAIQWEDEIWEVLSAEESPGGVRYELAPWDDQLTIRVLRPYDEASEAERAADLRSVARRRSGARVAYLLSPIVGLLPGRVQERLEVELGIRATVLTLASIPIPLSVGTVALVFVLASAFGPALQSAGPPLPAGLPILTLLLPESLLRLVVAMAQGVPIGSVLGLPLYLLGRVAGLVEPPPEAAATPGPEERRPLADRYLLLEPLLSFLPAEDQRRLAASQGFSPVTWGRRTAWFLLVYPGLTAPAHAWRLLAQYGGPVSVLLLVLTLALAVEQVLRLRALSRKEPAPSVLGRLVAPFAAPLLRGAPPGHRLGGP